MPSHISTQSAGGLTTSGTVADVAAFFRVSPQTVNLWRAEQRIGFWQEGRNVCFGEDAVVEFWVKRCQSNGKSTPAERTELVRLAWRAHLGIRRPAATQWNDLLQRIERLEARL